MSTSHDLKDITIREREKFFEFIRIADIVLQPFKCHAEMKKFHPKNLPTMYITAVTMADKEKVKKANRKWRTSPTGYYADCKKCEKLNHVRYLVFMRQYKRAFDKAEEIFEDTSSYWR
ncbi:hypothetical protein [Candidatus Uabimicrobium sp. HlEnr_7]|uniref:hypothetical protein n=1 Tax=Candidatus Uabimicrobium helgolandensis TaxID=3095367 RepID=UPI003558D651